MFRGLRAAEDALTRFQTGIPLSNVLRHSDGAEHESEEGGDGSDLHFSGAWWFC